MPPTRLPNYSVFWFRSTLRLNSSIHRSIPARRRQDVYISPNGALFVPPLQTVVPGGLSAVSPSTEAYFPVLKADWNPSDSRAASSVLVMIEEDQFSVLYQDVFLFKRVRDDERVYVRDAAIRFYIPIVVRRVCSVASRTSARKFSDHRDNHISI